MYSKEMEGSIRSEATLELGRKIVEELGMDRSVDTLGRWLAHNIAGLIVEAETKPDDIESQAIVRSAILQLWEHRYSLTENFKPLAESDLLLESLKRLHPESDLHRYFPQVDDTNDSGGVKPWIKAALHIDDVSQVLITQCMAIAAELSMNQSEEWVLLAKEADFDASVELALAQLWDNEKRLMAQKNADLRTINSLKSRLEKLEYFERAAGSIKDFIANRINELEKE